MSFRGGIDLISLLVNQMDRLTSSHTGVLVGEAYQLAYWLAVVWLVVAGLRVAAHSLSHHHAGFGGMPVLSALARVAAVFTLLHYYNLHSLPGTSSTVSTLFQDAARHYAHQIDVSAQDVVNAKIAGISSGTILFALLNPAANVLYFAVKLLLIVLEGLMLFVNVTPFLFLGTGSLFGPLFIAGGLLLPGCSFLFRNWCLFMAQMAFFRMMGTALLYVWATALSEFIDQAVHGNYSLSHFTELLLLLGALTIAMTLSLLGLRSAVSALFQGSGAAAGGIAGAVVSTVAATKTLGASRVASHAKPSVKAA